MKNEFCVTWLRLNCLTVTLLWAWSLMHISCLIHFGSKFSFYRFIIRLNLYKKRKWYICIESTFAIKLLLYTWFTWFAISFFGLYIFCDLFFWIIPFFRRKDKNLWRRKKTVLLSVFYIFFFVGVHTRNGQIYQNLQKVNEQQCGCFTKQSRWESATNAESTERIQSNNEKNEHINKFLFVGHEGKERVRCFNEFEAHKQRMKIRR